LGGYLNMRSERPPSVVGEDQRMSTTSSMIVYSSASGSDGIPERRS
jgi:hypothetical protein